MNDCTVSVFWLRIIQGAECFPDVLKRAPAITCILKPSEQCIWRAVLFSLIFSLTAKARRKPTGSQAVQHSASPAQKRTAKYAKTGLENRKTGSSPVLSTIKSSEISWFRSFFLHFAVKKFNHIFEVTFWPKPWPKPRCKLLPKSRTK